MRGSEIPTGFAVMLCVVHTTNVFSYGKRQYLLEDGTKVSASNKHKESCGYVGMEEGEQGVICKNACCLFVHHRHVYDLKYYRSKRVKY